MVRNEANHGWDLWVYGGQQFLDPTKGVNDIWILSMPAFMFASFPLSTPLVIWANMFMSFFRWIQIPNIPDNIDTIGHTCHAIGQQMLIIGGIPPTTKVAAETECSPKLLRLFNMHTKEVSASILVAILYFTTLPILIFFGGMGSG